MASIERLEREAEATRASIDQTLAELRARVSPERIVDQATDYASKRMNGDIVGTLTRQIARDPIPFALVGAGLAWLLIASRRRSEAVGTSVRVANRASLPPFGAAVASTQPPRAGGEVKNPGVPFSPLIPDPVTRAQAEGQVT